MTLAVQSPRLIAIGTGTRGPFAFTVDGTAIRVDESADLVVTRYASTTATTGTVLTLGVDYSVSGLPSAPSVTLDASQAVLASTERLVIERRQDFDQDLALASGGDFSSAAIEARLDKLTQFAQELKLRTDRSLKQHWLETAPIAMPPVTGRGGKALGFDAAGTSLIPLAPAVGTFNVNAFWEPILTSGDVNGISDLLDVPQFREADVTLYVGTQTGDYATLADAIAARREIFTTDGAIVKIIVRAGVHSYTTQVLLRSQDADYTFIEGEALVTPAGSFTAVSVTSNGSRDHDVTFTYSIAHGLSVGDFVRIPPGNLVGTGYIRALAGVFEVSAVPSPTTFTVKNYHIRASMSAVTITAGGFSKIPSVLKFTGTDILDLDVPSLGDSGARDNPGGLELVAGQWRVSKLCITTDGADTEAIGVSAGYHGGFLSLYSDVCIHGPWANAGIRSASSGGSGLDVRGVTIHGPVMQGIWAQLGTTIQAAGVTVTGCGEKGIKVDQGGLVVASFATLAGCDVGVGVGSEGGQAIVTNGFVHDNLSDGITATRGAKVSLSNMTFAGNGDNRILSGSYVSLSSSTFDALTVDESIASGIASCTITTPDYTDSVIDGVTYIDTNIILQNGAEQHTLSAEAGGPTLNTTSVNRDVILTAADVEVFRFDMGDEVIKITNGALNVSLRNNDGNCEAGVHSSARDFKVRDLNSDTVRAEIDGGDGSFRVNGTTVIDGSRGIRLGAYSAAQIADATHAVNTTNKASGKLVYDSTNDRVMVANGAGAADTWSVADGSATVTPA